MFPLLFQINSKFLLKFVRVNVCKKLSIKRISKHEIRGCCDEFQLNQKFCQVRDATLAVANVDDYASSAKLLAATTLRNILGTKTLADILSERESIAHDMQVRNATI